MADIWMDVDAALSEVPVNIAPLVDDTDGKTREEAVAYNAAGLELIWHFTTTAGATSATVVTPTTGGAYDWTHQDGGMYTIEMPASGGASANNDTEGFGWFTGVATGVLPWRGPVIGFRAAGLNNALIDSAYSATRGLAGTALPDAAADEAGGMPISDAGGLDLDTKLGYLQAAITSTILGRIDVAISTRSSHDAAAVKTAIEAAGSHLALIKAVTDLLPDAGALSSLATLANQTTIAGYIDTEVTAIYNLLNTEIAEIYAAVITNAAGADVAADIIALKAVADASLAGVPKNTELANFEFVMVLSSDHATGATSKTVTATRSIDGAAFASCANSVTEIANGVYKITLAAADLNGDVIMLRFAATDCDDTWVLIKTTS